MAQVAEAGRRCLLACASALAFAVLAPPAFASGEEPAWGALEQGGIVLFRHANAPGAGDPSDMRIDDCPTQRNLDEAGRRQARRIGEAFAARGIAVGQVLTSRWCRARETARLAFGEGARDEPAFDSFFDDRSAGPARTEAALRLLAGWHGPGALAVTTHQVNITALTGIVPASGEGIVIAMQGARVAVVGRIRP
jgi:phosphohistidine phosphatase SixA